ncbi:hypothetical protein D7V21_06200 [Acinetobacter guerrae]|uniref:Uncharacterized protein n=1 Tax=Acinetobacter guerrae TaxID=1843371 RepID=A0A3A8EW70_9GAMM|nr:hypothetical protein D7V21_06200 [Acinetobacter guerrae]
MNKIFKLIWNKSMQLRVVSYIPPIKISAHYQRSLIVAQIN